MKILKYIGIGLGGLIVLLAIIPVFLSSKSYVVRSVVVNAPADSVYNYLSDFKNFKQWSPWQEKDPNMTTSIEGSGVGAVYSWKGNDQVGSGSMTIASADPNKSVTIDLKFIAPWQSQAIVKWSVAPEGNATKVSWEMSQDLSYGQRYFGMMMDKMIGPDFEKGLSKLKANLEIK
ncbi:MAG TPA: SRPBCC family protein [Cytophagaceae bacterium]|jgi:uncharacterized protein YndB with AHSA1/START domain|nr:SRPBCC family protein [Cytophagaceae bacterium]